jgi:tight adherence protein C
VVIALPIGLLIPDWILGAIRRPYTRALRKGIADALDLLVVCTEAGMGLETALERVALEIRHSNPAMASALGTLLDELKVLPNRREALVNFGKRSGVDGIRRMATMLAQTLEYGTPLGQALRNVAGELRRERMARLEERAVRLPVLLVFPMIFLILPSLFIVMGGISFLKLLDTLNQMGGG